MGVEHSSGSQTLCYINADLQEECFRNEFEMHNVFEMGFDILQKEGGVEGLIESMKYAQKKHADLDHDAQTAAYADSIREYMEQYKNDQEHDHSDNIHDVEAIQKHLKESHLLAEPSAPIHDVLRSQAGLVVKEIDVTDLDVGKHEDRLHHASASPLHHYRESHHLAEGAHGHHRSHEEQESLEFGHKLMDYKTKQTGHEYRKFGHIMASYDQLQAHVRHNQCVLLKAEHQFHTETSQKWLCQSNLDDFWESSCIKMDPHLEICDEKAINLFLGKCIESDSFKVCPSDPVVVEHLKTEDAEGHHSEEVARHLESPLDDLHSAFEHGSCFKVDNAFICEEDVDHIRESENMCINVEHYRVCNDDLINLFHGDKVRMHDGHRLVADFPKPHHDHHSALCREHEEMEFCLENILDLYAEPHDCVMFAGEWLCQDEIVHAWKEGCIDITEHKVCGADMIDAVLQGCVDLDHEWVCPTAVGTKRGGY